MNNKQKIYGVTCWIIFNLGGSVLAMTSPFPVKGFLVLILAQVGVAIAWLLVELGFWLGYK